MIFELVGEVAHRLILCAVQCSVPSSMLVQVCHFPACPIFWTKEGGGWGRAYSSHFDLWPFPGPFLVSHYLLFICLPAGWARLPRQHTREGSWRTRYGLAFFYIRIISKAISNYLKHLKKKNISNSKLSLSCSCSCSVPFVVNPPQSLAIIHIHPKFILPIGHIQP